MATGEYVAFVDHDNRLEPTSFAQLMALQERTQAEIVMANFFFYVEGEAGFQVVFSKDDYFGGRGETDCYVSAVGVGCGPRN